MSATDGEAFDRKSTVGDGEKDIGDSAENEHADAATKKGPSEAFLQELQQENSSLKQQLDAEKELRIKAQTDLKGVRKQWKQLAQEQLSMQQTYSKPFHSVTDDYLNQKARELRYDVRCFAESYFEDLVPQRWPQQPQNLSVRMLPEAYEQCLACPVLAQSFVWRVLTKMVFDHFEWPISGKARQPLRDISRYLRPTSSQNDEEALKKFYTWRAMSAEMVFNAEASMNPQDSWKEFEEFLIEKYVDPFIFSLIPKSKYGQYYELLGHIIQKALIMDQEISRQAAWVHWDFEYRDGHAETAAGIQQEGLLIVAAPAMVKRGKSSGEGFEEEIVLLEADIRLVQEYRYDRYHPGLSFGRLLSPRYS
ncbi:hypothetical protein F4680DRAFT_441288 [Xylaria scruposa]|nr:hypothetical protein F4680DRAFT_441288 [Xylaria scruposa]